MYEIYYTSAPEGLKPSTRGFCTVAATEGLPRGLGERLEALSAYRHHFAAGDGAGGRNPVSYAHWLLAYGGSQYHVLSRICDSGLDYTRRTNAFAHHIALDNGEVAAENAGPAAVLNQAGVLQTAWDQRVGALGRTVLPRSGGFGEARACTGWQRVAGDAGWGGVLAESFTRNPPRPVCLLFSPGQEMLPLMAEAIALLPAALRWQVTFSTYFTSMPPSATCVWRCCLAGTPAGAAGMRYAAGGLVLDVSERGRLPALPDSPWVEYGRTGKMPAGVASGGAARATERKVPAAEILAADVGGAMGRTGTSVGKEPGNVAAADVFSVIPLDGAEDDFEEERVAVNRGNTAGRALTPGLMVSSAEERTSQSGDSEKTARWVLIVLAAIVAMVIIASVYFAIRALTPPPPPLEPDRALPVAADNQREILPAPSVDNGTAKPGLMPEDGRSATEPVVVVAKPVPVASDARVSSTIASGSAVAGLPHDLIMAAALNDPTQPPTSIDDKSQRVHIGQRNMSDMGSVTGLQLLLGLEGKATLNYKDSELNGIFTQDSEFAAKRPGVALMWKNPDDPGGATEVAFVRLEKVRNDVEVTWKARMLADPERAKAVVAAFWVLEHASILGVDASGAPLLKLHFKPPQIREVTLADGDVKIDPAYNLPAGAKPRVLAGLPAGWRADVVAEPEKDTPGVSQVLYIAKSRVQKGATGAGDDNLGGWFTIRFKPGWTDIENTLARNKEENEKKLADAQVNIKALDVSMNQKIADAEASLQGMGKATKDSRIAQLYADMAEPKKQKADLENTVAACLAVRQDLEEIKFLEIAVDLPGNLPGFIVRFSGSGAGETKE